MREKNYKISSRYGAYSNSIIRNILSNLALLTLLVLGAANVFVAERALAQETETTLRAAVIPDEEQGVIRFIIDGKEVARLDENGLYVVRDVTYGGTLTDTGSAWIEQHFEENANAE